LAGELARPRRHVEDDPADELCASGQEGDEVDGVTGPGALVDIGTTGEAGAPEIPALCHAPDPRKPPAGGGGMASAEKVMKAIRYWYEVLVLVPNPVNEVAARTVAAGVVLMAVVALVFELPWMLIPLTYGFWARVLTGPTLSPLGQLATRVVAPALRSPNG